MRRALDASQKLEVVFPTMSGTYPCKSVFNTLLSYCRYSLYVWHLTEAGPCFQPSVAHTLVRCVLTLYCLVGIHCALDASQKPDVVFPTICGIFSAAKAMKAKDAVYFVGQS